MEVTVASVVTVIRAALVVSADDAIAVLVELGLE